METDLDHKVFGQLLSPKYDFSNFSFEDFISIGLEAQHIKGLHQRILGRLAMALEIKRGEGTLKQFAKAIEIPVPSLYAFKSTEEHLLPFDDLIPADWTWTSRRILALQENPKDWIEKGVKEGWSSSELIREIALKKPKKDRMWTCPNCGENYFESFIKKELK